MKIQSFIPVAIISFLVVAFAKQPEAKRTPPDLVQYDSIKIFKGDSLIKKLRESDTKLLNRYVLDALSGEITGLDAPCDYSIIYSNSTSQLKFEFHIYKQEGFLRSRDTAPPMDYMLDKSGCEFLSEMINLQ